MGTKVFLAQSTRELLPGLAERLRTPQADPFAPEILVVPTAGARDWLIERLAHELDTGDGGILANVEFWFPNEFNLHAVGVERETDDPWSKANLRWTLLGLLHSGAATAPSFDGSARPLTIAERIAHLFDLYAVYRPEMPASWARSSVARDPQFALRDDKVWQFDLWKVVRDTIGESPGERFLSARRDLTAVDVERAVRGRISVFGLDVFSPAKVSLLAAMGEHVDVEIHAVFPSLAKVDVVRELELGDRLRRDVDLVGVVQHPLARSWARAGLETLALLTHDLPRAEVIASVTSSSVLGRLQRSIVEDIALDPPSGADREEVLSRGDGSVQIHLCHGATRQVEVLRDALLHRLADDPTLHPRDIVVVCPDLETFGPLLEPVMGARFDEGDDDASSLQLPIAIIDKSTATATPVAETIAALFDAVADRVSASSVLAVVSQGPVRRRFRFADDEIATIDGWMDELGVHWGLDGEFRTTWGYPSGERAGTWRAALDRLTAGILLQAERPREAPSGVVPFDDVSGSTIDLIGRFAELIDAIERFTLACGTDHTLDGWADIMDRSIDELLEVPVNESHQIEDARAVVRSMRGGAEAAGGATLGAREIAELFAEGLDGVRARSRVWGDVVRVASLSRLRGISARIVAVLGFDGRAFASGRGAGDDILLDEPRLAERDFHAEERLGLLGLIAAASDAFLVTCNGHDITNNAPSPMAVPLEELADALAAIIDDGTKVADADRRPVVVQHSRQLADPVNLGRQGSDVAKNVGAATTGPWTFDPTAATIAATVATAGAGTDSSVDTWPIFPWDPRFDDEPLRIGQLVDAIRRPSQVYVRERLEITLPGDEGVTDDAVVLWPDQLDRHGLAVERIEARRRGLELDGREIRALIGGVPMGAVAEPFWAELDAQVAALFTVGGVDTSMGEMVPVDVEVPVGGEPSSVRIVDAVRVSGQQLVTITYSKADSRHRTRPWIELAAITVQDPAPAWEAIIVSRHDKRSYGLDVERIVMDGATPGERRANAMRVLRYAVSMRRLALRAVVPLFERASWVADASVSVFDGAVASDRRDAALSLLFGEVEGWMLVDANRPENAMRPIDEGIGGRGTRFQRYAQELVTTFDETTGLFGLDGARAPITLDKTTPTAAQGVLAQIRKAAAKALKAAKKATGTKKGAK